MGTRWQWLRWRGEQMLAVLLVASAIGIGFITTSWIPSIVVLAFLFLFTGSLLYYGRKHEHELEQDGKPFTVIIPAYDDANVIEKSVKSLVASNYEDFEVRIVCEYGDLPTIRKAEVLSSCYDNVIAQINTTHPGSKAGALNHAIETTDTPYYAFFDADQTIHEDFLARASAVLETEDIFQGRCIPQPDGLIESLGYYEVFYIVNGPKIIYQALSGKYVPRSKAIALTDEAFETVGGFNESVLTEDIDFGTRCVEEDLSIVADHFSAPTLEEAPHTLRDWWGHRKRWLTGFLQVTRSNTKEATTGRQIGPAIALLTALIFSFLALIMLGQTFGVLAHGEPRAILVTLGMFSIVSIVIRGYDRRTGTIDSLGIGWLPSGLFFPLIGAATCKVIVERINGKEEDWYSIEKGEIEQNLVKRIKQDLISSRDEIIAQMKGQKDLIDANMADLAGPFQFELPDPSDAVIEQVRRQKELLEQDITAVTGYSEEKISAAGAIIKRKGKRWWPRDSDTTE